MLVHVSVTEEDIRRGMKNRAIGCPVALAMLRVTGKCHIVNADLIVSANLILTCPQFVPTPYEVIRFIEKFDAIKPVPVQPFEFDIELPWVTALPTAEATRIVDDATTTVVEEGELVMA